MTNMRILAAIFQVFPDINIEKILFTLSSVFISMLTERRSIGMHETGPGKFCPEQRCWAHRFACQDKLGAPRHNVSRFYLDAKLTGNLMGPRAPI